LGPVGRWAFPALSPDEKTVAATNLDNKVGDDIWLFDRSRGSSIRFTTEPGWDIGGIWSPDGQHIIFSSNRFGPFNLFRKPSTGGREELIFKSPMPSFPMHWSSNGRVFIYQAKDPTTSLDLWALSLGDGSRTRLVQSPFNDADGSLSPDMRWLLYMSEESGQPEVYVQRFPTAARKWRLSSNGGVQPSWRHDGREVVFLTLDGTMMAASIEEKNTLLEISRPKRLFQMAIDAGRVAHQYRMTTDGQRFVVAVPVEPTGTAPPITVVVNWLSGLKQKSR
jgi:Tol biopolymer transport system component